MKITNVTVTLWEWKDIPPTRYNKEIASASSGSTEMALVTINTDEGIDGYGFLGSALYSGKKFAPVVVEDLKPILMGSDPLARERLWQAMVQLAQGSNLLAVGAVDVALWDLAGRAAGVPVHRLIGSYRDSIPAYASSPVLDTPEDYAEQAARYKEMGWHAYKMHPHCEPDMDITICKAVRRAVGDDFRLMLDAVWSYDHADALRVGQAIQELGFYWYEDPLGYNDIEGYVRLKSELDIPLMATELPLTAPQAYAPWIAREATDFLRGDVALKGGLTSCLKTAHTAETFGLNYEVHHGGNSHNNHANLHLAMAIKNCELFEVLLPEEAQKHGLVQDIEIDENGLAHVPDRPGIGAEIDFESRSTRTDSPMSRIDRASVPKSTSS
jgi:L-alanine-DL-glutamate epimerase-like enolase superfamily enzyme